MISEDDPVVRTEIAVAGDLVSAYPDLTVREHLQLVSVAHGEGRLAADLVDRALAECRLEGHGGALPGSLSSGQLQALQLATVLVRPLRLMVLDEPEQRLDPAAGAGWPACCARERGGRGDPAGHAPHRARRGGGRARHPAQRRRGHRRGAAGRDAGGVAVTVTRDPIAVPDSTGATFALLRQLRRGHGRKQAANAAYWAYLAAVIVVSYGGTLIVTAYRALRHPPPATAAAPQLLHAAPAALTALVLLVFLIMARDALWRGPVTVPQATADWLLGTPVSRRRLLRPRFRGSAAGALLVGAVAGIVPAATLVALGLGGRSGGEVIRLAGAAMVSMGLLFALATGLAGLIERYPGTGRWVRAATPAALAAAVLLGGLAAWAGLGRLPPAVATVVLWSGPWGWAAQPVIAAAAHAVPARAAANPAPWWPGALALLAAAALAALACADRAVAGVPAAALRARARTLGAMSAAALSMNTRGVATAYAAAGGARRARFRLPPPRRRELVLPWRDLLALLRSPARLVSAVLLALLAALLIAVAAHGLPVSLVLVASGLSLGFLAAAWLCEGARLDADDPRRSVQLPMTFQSLAWWHAAVPCLVLLAAVGIPAAVVCLVTGDLRPLALLAVTIPVLVGGALVNVFRGNFSPSLFVGADTPVGNTAAISIVFWYAWGTVLAVLPMTVLVTSALGSAGPAPLLRALVIGAGLAAGLGAYAARRARRLRGELICDPRLLLPAGHGGGERCARSRPRPWGARWPECQVQARSNGGDAAGGQDHDPERPR